MLNGENEPNFEKFRSFLDFFDLFSNYRLSRASIYRSSRPHNIIHWGIDIDFMPCSPEFLEASGQDVLPNVGLGRLLVLNLESRVGEGSENGPEMDQGSSAFCIFPHPHSRNNCSCPDSPERTRTGTGRRERQEGSEITSHHPCSWCQHQQWKIPSALLWPERGLCTLLPTLPVRLSPEQYSPAGKWTFQVDQIQKYLCPSISRSKPNQWIRKQGNK